MIAILDQAKNCHKDGYSAGRIPEMNDVWFGIVMDYIVKSACFL